MTIPKATNRLTVIVPEICDRNGNVIFFFLNSLNYRRHALPSLRCHKFGDIALASATFNRYRSLARIGRIHYPLLGGYPVSGHRRMIRRPII